ncbi:MAG: hypothetical protein Q9166_006088 [cf. Caloplaca sp. 2 TL-2023]
MGNSGSTIAGTQNNLERRSPAPAVCPVDEKARKAWLEAVRKNAPPSTEHPASLISSGPTLEDERKQQLNIWHDQSDRGKISDSPPGLQPSQLPTAKQNNVFPIERPRQREVEIEKSRRNMFGSNKIGGQSENGPYLGTDRVTSSIPRADMAPSTTTPDPRSMPSSEGASEKTGNWIYPSEKMFFDAMKRKSFSPDQKDMPAIVPIHNAVNERAWSLIKTWETSSARLKALNAPCGGPKLRSFSGDAAKLSPKARVLGWVGYQAPFDRHDWVVERCEGGGSVVYVIDFYKGRGDGLAFYLDVRPKLNTWEGCRMRIGRMVGLG